MGILLACLDHDFPLNTSLVQIPALIKKITPQKKNKKPTTQQRRQKPCNHHPHTFSNKCIVFHVHQRVRPPGLRLFPFESHVHVVQQFRVVFFRSCFWNCFLCVDWIVPWIFFWTWNVMLLPGHLPRQQQRNREKTIQRSKKHTHARARPCDILQKRHCRNNLRSGSSP